MKHACLLALWLLAAPAMAQVSADDPALTPDATIAAEAAAHGSVAADSAAVRAVLADPATRATAVDLALLRMAPDAVIKPHLAEHLTALLADGAVQDDVAVAIAGMFGDMGVTPSNRQVIARMVGEHLAGWGEDDLLLGMARLPAAEQRANLALRVRFAAGASPLDCAEYLSGAHSAAQTRAMQWQVMAAWRPEDIGAAFALGRAAIIADLAADDAGPDLTFAELSQAEQAAGQAIMQALDATGDAAGLFAAFGYPEQATAGDICTSRLTMLQAVLGMTGPDAGLTVRYVTLYGLNG